jgi:ribose transport system ATP-binding protein
LSSVLATEGDPAVTDVALELRGISKSFGGVRALDDVSLTVQAHEIHGLLGRNGSGKSTLIKILSGYHAPDSGGRLQVRGQDIPLPLQPGQAGRLGVCFVHQDLGLIPQLSVLENMRVNRYRPGLGWRIHWKAEREQVADDLAIFDIRVALDTAVGALSPVERALVAIARAFGDARRQRGGVVVLDEPTAYLPHDSVDRLFQSVRQASASGTAVIFVSHRLDEVMSLTDRVSVLREGRVVDTVETRAVDESRLIELILGRPLEGLYPVARPIDRDVAVRVEKLQGTAVQDMSFSVHRGEILGLAGLVGMGQGEVASLLFGATRARSGLLSIGEDSFDLTAMTPRAAMRMGMALLPSDRLVAGGVASLSVRDNVSLPILASFNQRAWLHEGQENTHVERVLRAFDVRPPLPGHSLGTLSGGNQQKALLAKWLQLSPQVILLDEPSQGIDIGARKEIFDRIRGVVDRGACAILVSSEFEDLAGACDRVLICRYGSIVGELQGAALSADRVVELAYTSDVGLGRHAAR